MVWVSGWRLAAAVSEAGGFGLIGAGSMYPDVLRTHIRKAKAATGKPFGVNIPLMYPDIDAHMAIVAEEGVGTVFTSAGNPAKWTPWLKERGIRVVHVVANVDQARKAVDRGVDAVVAEGFEAGGHNGRDEITTFVLVPQVVDAVGHRVPVIAAGGIADGRGIAAALALGAAAVQIGSRFAATVESSAHPAFKQRILEAGDRDTVLTLKALAPTRMLKNPFQARIAEAEGRGASADELRELLGRGRAKRGIFEGDLQEGELEIGQVSGLIRDIPTVAELMRRFVTETRTVVQGLPTDFP